MGSWISYILNYLRTKTLTHYQRTQQMTNEERAQTDTHARRTDATIDVIDFHRVPADFKADVLGEENIELEQDLETDGCDKDVETSWGVLDTEQISSYTSRQSRKTAVEFDRHYMHGVCEQILTAVETGQHENVRDLLVKGSPCEKHFKMCLENSLKCEHLEMTMSLLWQLCKEIEEREGSNAVQVYPSYRLEARWTPVIVLLEKHLSRGKWEDFKGCAVYRRKYNLVSSDAAKVMSSDEVRKCHMGPDKKKAISDAMKSTQLTMSHSNITLISTSTVRSKGGIPQREDCLVIGCLVKDFIPFNEERFPKYIRTSVGPVRVDVREAFCTLSTNETEEYVHSKEPKANTFNEKLLIGTEIKRLGSTLTGTLGGFVKSGDGTVGFLTCAHVVVPNVGGSAHSQDRLKVVECEYRDEIAQPGSCFQNNHNNRCGRSRICGKVVKYAFGNPSDDRPGLDAALIQLHDRQADSQSFVRVETSQLEDADYTEESLPTYTGEIEEVDDKKEVIKVGAKSGMTTGVIVSDDCNSYLPITSKIKMPHGHTSELKHLIEVTASDVNVGVPFAIGGDSGAFVFTKDNEILKCIGMVVSTTSYGSACVIPIGPILQALNVEMYSGRERTSDNRRFCVVL